jgi:hypothetical protein
VLISEGENMKIACSLVFILAFCAPAGAQQVTASTGAVIAAPAPHKRTSRKKAAPVPGEAQKAAPASGQAQAAAAAPAQAQKAAVPAVQKAVQKAPPAEEEEPGAVMIDPRSDEDRSGRFTDNNAGGEAETEEAAAPGGMPVSYGQLKGSLNDAGRSLLVFENEDGEIAFVQVFIGKKAVTWKLISTIRRGGAATAE